MSSRLSEKNEITAQKPLPNDNNKPKQSIAVSTLFFTTRFDNRPYINVKVGDEIIPALVDTGAQMTVIGTNLIKDISKWGILHPYGGTVRMADCSSQVPKGEILVNYGVDDVLKTIPTIILNQNTKSLIVGMNFLNEFGIGITDIKENHVKIHKMETKEENIGEIHVTTLEGYRNSEISILEGNEDILLTAEDENETELDIEPEKQICVDI